MRRACLRRSVRFYEEIIYQTHVIIDPVAFGRIDDAEFRTIHGNFGLDVFTYHHITEIRDLLLTLFGNQKIVFVERDRDRKKRRGPFYLN
jgi:hypothetical protein